MASTEVGLPETFVPGEKKPDGSGIDLATTANVRWAAKLGNETYSSVAVADGRVFVGTNDASLKDPRYASTGGGLLMCLDERSGRLLWQLPVLRLGGMNGQFRKYANLKHDLGICSSPTVDGNRVYVVTNRGEVLCLDVAGMSNGNHGEYHDEARYTNGVDQPPVPLAPSDPDILWRFDTLSQIKTFPHDANCCSVLVVGDVVYVNTANGVGNDDTPYPDEPSMIALDKYTGRRVGFDDVKIGRGVFHGQWSSPSLAEVGGKSLILFGGGDGKCYAFEALSALPKEPVALKCVWSCDCNPPEYRVQNGKVVDYWTGCLDPDIGGVNKNDGTFVGPSEIIATPVFYKDRVYVTIGQDPEHGLGRGALVCIDPTKTGDISQTGVVWWYKDLQRSLCTVSVVDDLVYVADVEGTLHCVDANTGRPYWTHATKQQVWTSLLVADGKVYMGTRKCLWTLAAGKEKKVLGQTRLGTPIWTPAVAANSTLFVASQKYLWAAQSTRDPGKQRSDSSRLVTSNPSSH
jgi:outer membrane protein assembly factor BamB